MAETANPNAKNLPLTVLFVLWSIAVYAAFATKTQSLLLTSHSTFRSVRTADSVYVILSPLLALVLVGFVSSPNKARLVFWRIKNVLPGHKAFSVLAPGDPRLDMSKLRSRLPKWPTTPEEENSTWYSLYRKYAPRSRVYDSQRTFLLARDTAVIALLFCVLGAIGIAFFKHQFASALIYLLLTLIEYFVLCVVAQNLGRRFVCNVLAEFVSDPANRASEEG